MVAMEVREIVIIFEDGLSKDDERPGDVEAIGRPPIIPNAKEGVPNLLSKGAFHEAVLGEFRESLVTALVGGRDSHDLEPSADRQSIVKDQPIDILSGRAHPVNREPNLVGLVSQEFLPGLSSQGEALNEELCERSLRLSFRVNDRKASLGD
ncbi:unnamed protein product [Sphagnum tenellum]